MADRIIGNQRMQNIQSLAAINNNFRNAGTHFLQTFIDGRQSMSNQSRINSNQYFSKNGQLYGQSSRSNANSKDNDTDRFMDTGKLSLYRDFGSIGQLMKVSDHPISQAEAFRYHNLSNFQQNEDQTERYQQGKVNVDLKKQETKKQNWSQMMNDNTKVTNQHEPESLFVDNNEEQPNQGQDAEDEDCLQMVIQLDSQNSVNLKIKPNDDPTLLAKQFCYRNNIDPKVISILSKQIKQLQSRHLLNQQSHNHSTSQNQKSIKQSRAKSINKNSHNQSLTYVTQPILQKQNKENLANIHNRNIEGHQRSKAGKSVENYQSENNLQVFNPKDEDYNGNSNKNSNGNTNINSKRYIQTKQNSYNNTTYITNFSNPHMTPSETETVFDRLYKNSQAKIKKQQQQRQSKKIQKSQHQLRHYPLSTSIKQGLNQSTTYLQNLSASNIHHTSISQANVKDMNSMYQIKIYEKNVKLQKEVRNRNYGIKQELEMMRENQCKMVPEINPVSRLIVEKMRECQLIGDGQEALKNSHVRLYQHNEKSKQKHLAKMIHYQKKKQEMQMQQCSFHPKILKKSQMQTLNTSRFLLLHEDHYIRQNKIKTVKASQTKKRLQRHHPQINEVSKKIIQDKPFEQRMIEYRTKSQQKQIKIQKQLQAFETHQPVINKNSKNPKQPSVSIGEYLYSKSLQKKQPKNLQVGKVMPSVNRSSANMYQQMKKNAFRYIFTLMDSDEDGYISALKINILGLDVQILQMLAPLLCEMEEVQIQLDEEQFVDAIQRLFNTFSIHEKNMVLNVYKNPLRKTKAKQEPSFHPSLNEKSIQIAKQIREPGTTLYQLGRERQMQKQAKLSQIRALKALLQFQQCTFHPNLMHHH